MTEPRKPGRPTDSVKCYTIKARVNKETLRILDIYCEKRQILRAAGIREAIHRLKEPEW